MSPRTSLRQQAVLFVSTGALLLSAAISAGRAASTQVVERDGMTVEFLGLDEWDPARIDAALTGGSNAEVYYCAANLKQDLGMADASVLHDVREDGRRYVIVTLVEPRHADRVQFKPAPRGPAFAPLAWSELQQALTSRSVDAQRAVLELGSQLQRHRKDPSGSRAESNDGDTQPAPAVDAIWRMLDERRTQVDFDRAIRALSHEPDPSARMAAAAILATFPDRNLTLYALVEGLRDSDAAVRTTCGQALISWIRYSSRPVDWAPVAGDLRHILAGTNLFAFPWILELLVASEVSRDLASTLLYDGGDLLLDALMASHPKTSARAGALLKHLGGVDFGTDRDAWERWIRQLQESR